MNLVQNCCRLLNRRINNIYNLGGYLDRNITTVADYKIKWTRPEKIPIIRPEQSFDLGLNVSVNPTDLPLHYDGSKELESASDIVKKMFTLEFQPGRETRNVKREKIIALVKRHKSDRGSAETAIAAMTSEIHDLQKYMEEHPRNRRAKVFLKEIIERRRKFLRLVRKWDYRRFEWILERLNLQFKLVPMKDGMVSRKESLTNLTQKYCDNITQGKLDAYKAELKSQQKGFYREKAEKLAFILKEEKECGVPPTVTEEEIEMARRKAEEL